jgi:hypothetical protein
MKCRPMLRASTPHNSWPGVSCVRLQQAFRRLRKRADGTRGQLTMCGTEQGLV